MDFASFWWTSGTPPTPTELTVWIRAANNGTTTNENILISDLFTTEQWSSDLPKRVIIENGAIVGGTGGNVAMRTGTGRTGGLTIENRGRIEGQGGSANGGNGFVALQANQAATLLNTSDGFIGGGGGGGGQGGQGGKGGNGSYSSTVSLGQGATMQPEGTCQNESLACCNLSCTTKFGTADGVRCCDGNWNYNACRGVGSPYHTRTCYCCVKDGTVSTTGTAGGAGGAGGVGQGYNQANAGTGANGVAGANPPTNAGRGGTGGKGGDGGAWASAGSQGGSGATGANGTVTNGSAGSAGSAGGSGAVSIENAQLLTITNDGTIAGEFQYTATIFSANNSTSTNEDVNVLNLFTGAQWSSTLPKIVTIETGAIVGATSTSNNALTIPNSGGGIVSIINNGEIQGAGGSANGGAGGRAVLVQKANTVMLIADGAAVRGGGGGGGKGGQGGKGGNGSATTTYVGRTVCNGGDCNQAGSEGFSCSNGDPCVGSCDLMEVTAECTKRRCSACQTSTTTTGTNGGAGGNGGRGQGYRQSAATGVDGVDGANPPTNAGRGGRGGRGGTGGSWGNGGGTGNTGAKGANGTVTNGSNGVGGSGGGAGGISISGTSLLTLTNLGTLSGNTSS